MKISDFMSRGLMGVENDMGEIRNTTDASIVFPNGWVASILDSTKHEMMGANTRYSVAVCDYNGYFNWDVLIPFGAKNNGTFDTDSEDEVCRVLTVIECMR